MAAAPVPDTHYESHQAQFEPPTQSGQPVYAHAGQAHPAYGHVGETPSITYRPSTAGSGGSSGGYTTRPGSRDGTIGHANIASVPRVAPHEPHYAASSYGYPGSGYDQHADVRDDTPPSRPSTSGSAGPGQPPVSQGGAAGGGPRKPPAGASKPRASQQVPTPPRNVKLEGSKIKGTFTVHGIDKGKPYIKGVDKKNTGQHYDLSWSDKNERFYISLGDSRKDRIYLTGVKV